MKPAEIIVEITEEGGEIRMEDGRLKVKNIPARLIPVIREHKAELLALLKDAPQSSPPAQTDQCATPTASVRPEPSMAPQSAPATVTCGSCVRFQPGTTKMGIGVCSATSNGLPPKEQRGYLAAYPLAPRQCRDFDFQPTKEIQHG